MHESDSGSRNDHGDRDRMKRSLEYLRRRSQHRLWWGSARIALGRASSGTRLGVTDDEPRRRPR